jgi:hypothetical protein
MTAHKIQVGQVWKKDASGETYLITKVYSEALATFVLLRKTGAESEAPLRVRVERNSQGQKIPGFTYAQGGEDF